jgi:Arc/MetJ family transcription regulator
MGDLMTKNLVDLDDEALAGAAEWFGTTTPGDTVNAALRDAAARAQRARALAEMVEIAKAGQFDELLDKRNRP